MKAFVLDDNYFDKLEEKLERLAEECKRWKERSKMINPCKCGNKIISVSDFVERYVTDQNGFSTALFVYFCECSECFRYTGMYSDYEAAIRAWNNYFAEEIK